MTSPVYSFFDANSSWFRVDEGEGSSFHNLGRSGDKGAVEMRRMGWLVLDRENCGGQSSDTSCENSDRRDTSCLQQRRLAGLV